MIVIKKLLLINLIYILFNFLYKTSNGQQLSKFTNQVPIPVNILLLLPNNDTYKFSLSKVLVSLDFAIKDLKNTDYGSKFEIDIISDTCDCTGIKAPVNAMENIYRKRNHTKNFHAVFGPMCD
jgi:hypothetical protein